MDDDDSDNFKPSAYRDGKKEDTYDELSSSDDQDDFGGHVPDLGLAIVGTKMNIKAK